MRVEWLLASAVATASLFLPGATASDVGAASTGPFVGTVAQGETDQHVFDNNPSNRPCIQLATHYTVQVVHAPTTDTLTLSVGSRSDTSANGLASVVITAGVCTRFTISVTGTNVDLEAAYAVEFVGELAALNLPPGDCTCDPIT